MNFSGKLFSGFILFMIWATACSMDQPESDLPLYDPETHFLFTIDVQQDEETMLSPSALYLYHAEYGLSGNPDVMVSDDGYGRIQAGIEKNEPFIAAIHSAWHKPVYLFLPSFAGDKISVTVQPETHAFNSDMTPVVLGNFNNFDDFRSVPMTQTEPGVWQAEIESELDTLTYFIEGIHGNMNVHGTAGNLSVTGIHPYSAPGIKSVLLNDSSDRFVTGIDLSLFPSGRETPIIHFDEDTPLSFSGIASVYSAMMRQYVKIQLLTDSGYSVTTSMFDDFLIELQHIAERFPHPETENAAGLAKAAFSEFLHPDDEWIDSLIADIPSGSELWLLYTPVLSELYEHSSRMEEVSRSLWDIYRQHGHRSVQGEALFNLLRFHYERGEDEEWYQAHFDLVREYPGHPRINYSYKRGYAPEAVVHMGRYFPDLEFSPLYEGEPVILPSRNEAPLTILYFWSIDHEASRNTIAKLQELYKAYPDTGLEVYTIAIGDYRSRVQRFHEMHQLPWQSGFEQFSSPVIQSMGITEVPYTIILNRENRVLILDNELFTDSDVIESIEIFLQNSL